MRLQIIGYVFFAIMVSGCSAGESQSSAAGSPATADREIVYGDDNRRDVYDHPDEMMKRRARMSTVALMLPKNMDQSDPNNIKFAGRLQDQENLCSDQRFLNDPTAAFCSGTLIDDDIILTAGHCIQNEEFCAQTKIVFNYYRTDGKTLATVTTSDVFQCKSILAREQIHLEDRIIDYAVLRIDRKATPRFEIVPLRLDKGLVQVGQPVGVVGSGTGLPFKVDTGGKVRDVRADTLDYFIANSDTFAGNSGAAVYDLTDYSIVGILVFGDLDYVSRGEECNTVYVCDEHACMGEGSVYVSHAIDGLCRVASNSPRLCPPNNPDGGIVNSGADWFEYTAYNTNNATQNTANWMLSLGAGETLTIGTCGLPRAKFNGDTFLRLEALDGTTVAFADEGCPGVAGGSNFSYKAPSNGTYKVKAGCYYDRTCTATVAWAIKPSTGGIVTGSFNFNTTQTTDATRATIDQTVALKKGSRIVAGTCGIEGGVGNGDTHLRLANAGGVELADNDDACNSRRSQLQYTATIDGEVTIRAGCFGETACSGTVAYQIE